MAAAKATREVATISLKGTALGSGPSSHRTCNHDEATESGSLFRTSHEHKLRTGISTSNKADAIGKRTG